jgi:hypothetical protein
MKEQTQAIFVRYRNVGQTRLFVMSGACRSFVAGARSVDCSEEISVSLLPQN